MQDASFQINPTEINAESQKRFEWQNNIVKYFQLADNDDAIILSMFYFSGKDFPYDTQGFCFPILFKEMKMKGLCDVGSEALRKRLYKMTKFGLLVKDSKGNPSTYLPSNKAEIAEFVRVKIKGKLKPANERNSEIFKP